MIRKSKIAIVTLISSLSFGAAAQASEVSLEQLVAAMMTQAISDTQQELRYNVEEAVLTATYAFDLGGEKTYFAKTTITDLESEDLPKHKAE
ncbi:MAG: molecular chaperone DnaK (HSP70) [Paraglaciecola sp.]|jgi:molecular chaperone DnaK (HSP70)